MNNIEQGLKKSADIQSFAKNYFSYLYKLLDELDPGQIAAFAREMENARQNCSNIFFVGNGGSAATASHMANDFSTDIHKRTLTDKPFRAMSLTDNCAVMLAVANDTGYENIFVNQLRIHYRKGDKLVAISASGNSPNVVVAAEWVKKQGGAVIALVGFDGGKLKEIGDVVVQVKAVKGEYGPVEDIHMILDHLVSYWLQYQIQKKDAK
jgi:D-sedoheptulose 7-phosphate isomerase